MTRQIFINFFFILLGSSSCFALHSYLNWHVVIASSVVGLVFSLLIPQKQAEIYCGSFIGMSSFSFLISPWSLVFSSLSGAVIFHYFQNRFIGFGGKLGSIAFYSVVSLLLIRWAL